MEFHDVRIGFRHSEFLDGDKKMKKKLQDARQKKIWKGKVIPSIFGRSEKLRLMQKHFVPTLHPVNKHC